MKKRRRKVRNVPIMELAMQALLAKHVATRKMARSKIVRRYGKNAANRAMKEAKETLQIVGL